MRLEVQLQVIFLPSLLCVCEVNHCRCCRAATEATDWYQYFPTHVCSLYAHLGTVTHVGAYLISQYEHEQLKTMPAFTTLRLPIVLIAPIV
jgi:hypothetical protein